MLKSKEGGNLPLMTQKNFVFIFIIVALVAVAGVVVGKLQESPASSNPQPDLTFDSSNPTSSVAPTSAPSGIKQYKSFPLLTSSQIQGKKATITTARGQIVFQFYPEASMAASSFIYLAGQHFFDGLTFHRVEPGFVIQGGDPLGNGTGGPGYRFPDELGDKRTYTKGTVAMANAGPDTNGSQFFIMLADHPELPHNYTIFGAVISGMDVVEKIEKGDVMQKVEISQ